MLEAEAGQLVVVVLRGARRDDIEIVINHGEMLIKDVRRWPTLRRPARVHRVELPPRAVERRLPLPPW